MSFELYDELIDLFEKHFDNIIDELDWKKSIFTEG